MLKPIMISRKLGVSYNRLEHYLRTAKPKNDSIEQVTKRFLILRESETSLNRFLAQLNHTTMTPTVLVQQLELILPQLHSSTKLQRLWDSKIQIDSTIFHQTQAVHHISLKPISKQDQPWLNHLVLHNHFLYKPVFRVINPNYQPNQKQLINLRFNLWQPSSCLKQKHHLLIGQLKKPLNFFIKNTKPN